MQDVTTLFLVGSVLILIAEYYLRTPSVYLIGEVLGVGGMYQAIAEYQDGTITSEIAVLFCIISLMAIIYSAMNFVNFFSKMKR